MTLYSGQAQQFGFTMEAPTNRLVWASVPAGLVNSTGYFVAPQQVGSCVVTAISFDDPRVSASATVMVVEPRLQIAPSKVTLAAGQTYRFGYAWDFNDPQGLIWSTTAGTIDQTGFLIAPASGTFTVSVASKVNPTKTSSCQVTVVPPDLRVLPSTASMMPGKTFKFSALVTSGGVTWSVVEPGGGSIASDGTYTAPATAGTYTIKATHTLIQNFSVTAHVFVSVNGEGFGQGSGGTGTGTSTGASGISVTLTPTWVQVDAGTYFPFEAVVAGAANSAVTWSLQSATDDASIDSTGVFHASRQGVYTVVASSTADPTATVQALVTVSPSLKRLSEVTLDLGGLYSYSVTALQDGRILIAGGAMGGLPGSSDDPRLTYQASSYLYDPGTRALTATGSLITPRSGHRGILLNDGRVLIAGGFANWANPQLTQMAGETAKSWFPFAEIYDPVAGTFSALSSQTHPIMVDRATAPAHVKGPGMMWSNHNQGDSVVLPDGNVILAGGYTSDGDGLNGYEGADLFGTDLGRFDLTRPGWKPFPAGWKCRMVKLNDGRIYVHIGLGQFVEGMPITDGIFDPGVSSYTSAVPTTKRVGASATLLPNGKVLLVGGYDLSTALTLFSYGTTVATAELFDPATGQYTPTGSLQQAREGHAGILLPSGQVLVVGGMVHVGNGVYQYPNKTELYDPDAGAFSVMDTLDYGLSDPKLVLMNNGGVFVAGQVQAPMDPPITTQGKTSANRLRAASLMPTLPALTVGSSLLGTIAPSSWSLSDLTLNQGVEVAGSSAGGTFTVTGTQTWKNVPLIVDRPALVKFNLVSGNQWSTAIPVNVEIPDDATFTPITIMAKPSNTGMFGGYKPSTKLLLDAFVLPRANVKVNLAFKITIQPPETDPVVLNLSVPFQAAPPLNVDLVPVDYVYKDSAGVRQQYTLSDAEMSAYKTGLEATLKELYPTSLGQITVTVQPFRSAWSEDGKDVSGADLWQVDPSNPSVPFSGLLDASSNARTQKWTNLETYFFQQMNVKPTGAPGTPSRYAFPSPKNRYVIGVIPVVAGTTVPTTPGTAYTAGGALTGECHFVVALNQSALDAAHELGHAHGRQHAPYGGVANPEPSWPTALSPYSGAAIGVPGWSVTTQANAPDKPATKKDIMCYPDDRSWYWISDYTFYYLYQWEKQSETAGDH